MIGKQITNPNSNRMKLTYQLLIPAVATLLFFSCAKETPENTWPANTSSNGALNNLFAQNAPTMQQFSLNAASGGSISGVDGANIYFVPNAFVYQNNTPVTGSVTIYLQEVYTKSDIIYSGGFTTANGLPLVSGGEINVTAYQGTQELKLAGPGRAYATIPAIQNAPPMQKFRASSFGSDNDFVQADTSTINAVPDSAAINPFYPYNYGFGLDSLNWTNCDQYFGLFYNTNATMTEFSLPVPQLFDAENSFVFVTSSYATFAARIWDFDTVSNAYLCNYYRLPVGYDFTFTIVSEINGTFYYDSRTVTIQENISIALNPQITTEAQVLQNIGNL